MILSFNQNCKPQGQSDQEDLQSRPIRVVATIGMIADVIQNIGGERVEVLSLMGPGSDPHLYNAREGDIHKMYAADIIFYNGLHLEAKMSDVLGQMNPLIKTAAVSKAIEQNLLLNSEEREGNAFVPDPHIWFDVSLWIKVTEYIRDVLIEINPESEEIYQEGAIAYLQQLQDLEEYVKDKANQIPEDLRVIITAHDAFQYFGRAYGFQMLGLQGISTASETGAANIRNLADFIATNEIPAIFAETTISDRSIKALQEAVESRGFNVKIGGELYSDAMGPPGSEADTYIGMIQHNIDTITSSLTGSDAVLEVIP